VTNQVETLVEQLQAGRITRRQFIRRAAASGLSLSMAMAVLEACAPAESPSASAGASAGSSSAPAASTSGARGGAGTLRFLTVFFSGTTFQNLQPHHNGPGEYDVVRAIFEPLASVRRDGTFVPVLATEIPSVENGGVAADGKSVTWKLKEGVTWHDGQPFTADDVIFTWQFVTDEATAAQTIAEYLNIESIDKITDHEAKINFKEPTPLWFRPFTGNFGMIIPEHLLKDSIGAAALTAPFNQNPVGTGPYKFAELKTDDVVIVELNEDYHVEGQPHFDRVEFKQGGDDSPLAARAVLQAGEHDYAVNMGFGIDKEQLQDLSGAGAVGRVVQFPGVGTEHVQLNSTDPNKEVDGERSSLQTQHPYWSDDRVREAVSLAIDKQTMADTLGPLGAKPAVYYAFQNKAYLPADDQDETKFAYDPDRANQILDEAGWTRGADGVRARDGVRMRSLFQTSASTQREAIAAAFKSMLEAIGIEVELKSIPSDVFFASDPSNPDTYVKFQADLQMYSAALDSPDPQQGFGTWTEEQIPTKANNWVGSNNNRFRDDEYNEVFDDAGRELDPEVRASLLIRMNEILRDAGWHVWLWHSASLAVAANSLQGPDPSPFDTHTWNLGEWLRSS
jgi:peptide/nickel transport system substrate-binding protein